MSSSLHSPARNTTFQYKGQELFCENLPLNQWMQKFDRPVYVYSKQQIQNNAQAWTKALSHSKDKVFFAVKANPCRGILELLHELNLGFDTVSIGEVRRALRAGAHPTEILFSGVGKSKNELREAVQLELLSINVESQEELYRLRKIAQEESKIVRIAFRCNPDVDAHTHPYISTGLKTNKFGLPIQQVKQLFRYAQQSSWLHPIGLSCHIGSQITEVAPYLDAVEHLITLIKRLEKEGEPLHYLDIGGGLGIAYTDEDTPPTPSRLIQQVRQRLQQEQLEHLGLFAEPGRSIIGNAGALLTRIEYIKKTESKNFCIVNASMTEMIRPAMYQARMRIVPLLQKDVPTQIYDVVGPVCETSDFLGKERSLCIEEDDCLAILDAGAYGASMASQYNSRPLPSEYLVDQNNTITLQRHCWRDMLKNEHSLKKI